MFSLGCGYQHFVLKCCLCVQDQNEISRIMQPGCIWKNAAWLCNQTAFCIIFDPEDGGNILLRNVNIHLEYYSVTAQTNKIWMRTARKNKINCKKKKCKICKMPRGTSSHCRQKQPRISSLPVGLEALLEGSQEMANSQCPDSDKLCCSPQSNFNFKFILILFYSRFHVSG